MNWYHITTKGHVDKYGVDKTTSRYARSDCDWSKETLQCALSDLHEKGISDLRIIEFRVVSEPTEIDNRRSAINIDAMLGI